MTVPKTLRREKLENIAMILLALLVLFLVLHFIYQNVHGVTLPSSRWGTPLPQHAVNRSRDVLPVCIVGITHSMS
ncbi:MAG: hypothetical protein QOE55_5043 [Acidobacteriaceae bacterium]|jgi:uncharacterized integral membrane protein|nr:hypothetical protein [Acidobacteriaceae bacterium]